VSPKSLLFRQSYFNWGRRGKKFLVGYAPRPALDSKPLLSKIHFSLPIFVTRIDTYFLHGVHMRQKKLLLLLGCLLSIAQLAGCGGGGGDSGAAPNFPGNPPIGSPGTQPILNAGLSGKLFMTSPDSYIEFDLATGVSRIMRPKAGSMYAANDGQEFAFVNIRPPDQSASSSLEELVFFGRDGRQSGRFLKADGFGGRPLISPDKQTVLVEWHSIDLGDAGGVAVPTVFRRDGSIVKRFTNYGGYAWLPDGRILLTRGDSIFVTSLSASGPTLLRRFPNNAPGTLSVSPDGSRIAFVLNGPNAARDSFDFHAFVMNVDGTGLKQVTTSILGDAPVDFSPDGNSLLVADGSNFFSFGPGFFVAGCAELYVVPLNITNSIVLDRDSPTAPAIKLREVSEQTGETRSKVCAFSKPSWRNVPALEAPQSGTTIAGAGVNRGLSGIAYYGFASDLYRTNLLTGETANLGRAPNTPYPSLDGAEIILFDRFLTPAASSEESILFLDSNGVRQRRIDYLESFNGVLKFSPDKTKVAANWTNTDRGDPGGVSIITIFDRDFTRRLQRFEDFSSFEWLPDGRLLLTSLNELWIAPATLDSIKKVASFSDVIGGIASSRNGQQLAFNSLGNIWTVNLIGSGTNVTTSVPVRLTDTSQLLGRPEFSPDGKVIIVNAADSPRQTWAVPVDGQRVPIMNLGVIDTSAFQINYLKDGAKNSLLANTTVWWR
jgi:WD40 repeat protein